MWKKLALLVAVASAVTQAVRYWNEAGVKTAAQRKRAARHDVQRWEDEGGNLPPAADSDTGPARATAAGRSPRASSGSARRAGRGQSDSASASA